MQNIFTKYIEEELRDNNEARAHASNFGIDYDTYQGMIKKANNGQGPTPKQFIAEKMMEQLKGYWPGISGSPKEDVTTMATLKERQAFDAEKNRLDRISKEKMKELELKYKQIEDAKPSEKNTVLSQLFGDKTFIDQFDKPGGMTPEVFIATTGLNAYDYTGNSNFIMYEDLKGNTGIIPKTDLMNALQTLGKNFGSDDLDQLVELTRGRIAKSKGGRR